MALFGKNKPAAQKHPIIEVIKYDGPNDVLIWRFQSEDFNTNTQLIVGPAQEAIFVKGGQVMGRFISGTYTLSTKNYPFVRALVGLATGGVSPFSCIVYYVNKVISMGIDWGTDAPIRIIDPHYGVPVSLTGYGDFSVQVENGQKLLEKLVGATPGYSQEEIKRYFTSQMATQVNGVITGIIVDQKLSLYGIDSRLPDLSLAAQERVSRIFEPYGLSVNHFTIAKITYSGLEEIEAQIAEEARANIAHSQEIERHRVSSTVAAEDTVKAGRATAEANRALGFSAKDQAIAQIGQTLAGNPGPLVGGAGGMGVFYPGFTGGNIVQPAAAGTVDIVRILSDQPDQSSQPAAQPAQEPFEERARKIKFLLDNGMITPEQYQEKLTQLMNEI